MFVWGGGVGGVLGWLDLRVRCGIFSRLRVFCALACVFEISHCVAVWLWWFIGFGFPVV